MSNVNDCKLAALETLTGLTGNVNDMEKVYLADLGATSSHINNAWMEVFLLNGATSANWNTAANQFLIALGAPFLSLPNNWQWFWCVNNGVVGPVFQMLADVDGAFVNDIITGDGVYDEANTSTRYYADDTATPIWQPFTSGQQAKTFAGTKWWSVGQPGHTNDQIQSNDLTNVEWTATTMTVTKDQVGMRGDANGACLLVATAANATVVANAITDASDDQTTRWFIERGVGTGGVELSVDGEVSWVDVTASVDSAAGFNECLADQAALANPQIAIRLVVDTDEVIVANAECHLGELKEAVKDSSPVFTVAAPISIGSSDLGIPDTNHDDTEGLWYCEFRNAGLNAVNTGGMLGLGSTGRLIHTVAGTTLRSRDSATNTAQMAGLSFTADDTEFKLALAYGSSLQTMITDGVAGTPATYSGTYANSQSKIRIACSANTAAAAPLGTMLIRDIRRYNLPYAQALIKGVEITT